MKELNEIMLVEDEPDIREVATLSLQELGGFNLIVCESGQQALDQIKHKNTSPQLILLDVMMPGMDGPTTLSKLKEIQASHAPIIFMTARVQAHEIDEYMRLGAIAVIAKPFDPVALPNQIKSIWEKYLDSHHEKR